MRKLTTVRAGMPEKCAAKRSRLLHLFSFHDIPFTGLNGPRRDVLRIMNARLKTPSLRKTLRISVTVELDEHEKIVHLMRQEHLFSVSQMAHRLLREALERYPDPAQPLLPL